MPGTLRFDPDEGATLDLLGSFGRLEDSVGGIGNLVGSPTYDIILGLSSHGKDVTLKDCRRTQGNFRFGSGFSTSAYAGDTVFVGEHFERPEDVGFEGLSVEYSHLEEWAGVSGFALQMPHDPKAHPFTIEHQIPERISFSVGEIRISLRFGARHKHSSLLVREASIIQYAYVMVEFPEKRALDDLLEITYRIQNFLSFGVRSPIYPLSVRGIVASGEEANVEIHYRSLGRTGSTDKVHPVDMLFTLQDLPGGLDRALGTWLERSEVLDPVYRLYLGTVYNPNAFLEQRFLNLVQALEAYHRRAMPTTDLPEAQHERRKEEILEAVPERHREWLEGKLEYSNEPSLGRRLKDIIRKYPKATYPVAGENSKDRDSFIYKVTATRNYRTHFDKRLEDETVYGENLYRITEKLKLLMEACLMGEIGFGADEIRAAISGRR